MSRYQTIMTIAFLLFCYSDVYSNNQIDNSIYKSISIPKSPEAAAFDRVGKVPVSQYTGMANFSIPLYSIVSGDITLPISLDYQGGAIPVEQEATWVGLNWLLNVGGMITVQMGLHNSRSGSDGNEWADGWRRFLNMPFMSCYYDGEFQVGYKISALQPAIANYGYNWFKHQGCDVSGDVPSLVYEDILGYHNGEAPYYHAVFLGNSLNFVWDQFNGEFMQVGKKQNFTIDGTPTNITITDGNGIRFHFGEVEITQPDGSLVDYDRTPINYTFYLTSIVSPTGHTINLTYTEEGTYWPVRHIQEELYDNNYPSSICSSIVNTDVHYDMVGSGINYSLVRKISPYYVVNKRRLQTITADDVQVVFNAITPRLDLNVHMNSTGTTTRSSVCRLDNIEVFHKTDARNSLLRKFEFSYSYYTENRVGGNMLQDYWADAASDDVYSDFYPNDAFIYKRLRLDAMTEIGSDGARKPSYQFGYSAINLPGKNSAAQDYWGYYNGQENCSGGFHSLLPKKYGETKDKAYIIQGVGGNPTNIYADRRTYPYYTEAGMLCTVTHPTGAIQSFIYESNTFNNYQYESGSSNNTNSWLINRYPNDPILVTTSNSYSNPSITSASVFGCNIEGAYDPRPRNNFYFLTEKPIYVQVKVAYSKSNGREPSFWSDFYQNVPQLFTYESRYIQNQYVDIVKSCSSYPISRCDTTLSTSSICYYDTLFLVAGRHKLQVGDFEYLENSTGNHTIVMTVTALHVEKSSIGCGVRIASIKNYHDGIIETTDYSYSDGMLMSPAIFAREKILIYQGETSLRPDNTASVARNITYKMESSHNLSPNPSVVTYGKVSETVLNQQSDPMRYKDFSFWHKQWGGSICDYYKGQEDPRNGLVTGIRVYDENHNLRWKQSNDYRLTKLETRFLSGVIENCYYGPNSLVAVNSISSYNPWFDACTTGVMDIYQYPAVRFNLDFVTTTTTIYDGNDSIVNINETYYDEYNNMPSLEVTKTSISDQKDSVRYHYAFHNNRLPWATNMVGCNITSKPVQTLKYHNGTLSQGQLIVYNPLGQPESIWERRCDWDYNPGTDFDTLGYRQVQSAVYDPISHNARTIIDKKTSHKHFLWGYHNKYPIAEIVGSDMAHIEDALSVRLQDLEASDRPLLGVDSLHAELSSIGGVLVTTYSYDAEGHVTAIVGPDGVLRKYEYDSFGRLSGILDHQGNIISKYRYNYHIQ